MLSSYLYSPLRPSGDYLDMRQSSPEVVTGLLHAWRSGDSDALESLVPLIYDQLHRMARHSFAREANQVTLQPTALINELFLRMLKSDMRLENRTHFFAVCSKVMRAILVDHARARQRAKRGGDFTHVTLQMEPASPGSAFEFHELNDVLDRLKENDPRLLEVVEMHYFGGLTHDEIALALRISPATVYRDLKLSKAWIRKELKQTRHDAG